MCDRCDGSGYYDSPDEPCPKCRPEEYRISISCLGVDDKIHTCDPASNYTTCGIKIRTKKFFNREGHYSCYECTF